MSFLRKKIKWVVLFFLNAQDYIPFIVTEMIYNLMILSPWLLCSGVFQVLRILSYGLKIGHAIRTVFTAFSPSIFLAGKHLMVPVFNGSEKQSLSWKNVFNFLKSPGLTSVTFHNWFFIDPKCFIFSSWILYFIPWSSF